MMESQKVVTSPEKRGVDSSVSLGEATLAALEMTEQIQNSQLSFCTQDLKELCLS